MPAFCIVMLLPKPPAFADCALRLFCANMPTKRVDIRMIFFFIIVLLERAKLSAGNGVGMPANTQLLISVVLRINTHVSSCNRF